jgi:hypothetical protein
MNYSNLLYALLLAYYLSLSKLKLEEEEEDLFRPGAPSSIKGMHK